MTFDERDKENLGRPFHFDLDHYLKAVEQMVMADEIVTALDMLDKIPSWYRVNQGDKIHALRKEIYQNTMTIFDYAKEPDEVHIVDRMSDIINQPRGPMVLHFVKSLNDKGIKPNIYDFGPASFWIPLALQSEKCLFDYKPFTINTKALAKATEMGLVSDEMRGSVNVFLCMEVIEHLFYPKDMIHWYYHDKVEYDYALISTPQHTMGGGREDWRTREIGHIRTYSAVDFLNFVHSNIRELGWTYFDDHMQILLGAKNDVYDFKPAIDICKLIQKDIDKQLGYY